MWSGARRTGPARPEPVLRANERRSCARTSSRQTPRSRFRQVNSTDCSWWRCGMENSHGGQRSRRRLSATETTTRPVKNCTRRAQLDVLQAQQARESLTGPSALTRMSPSFVSRLTLEHPPARRMTATARHSSATKAPAASMPHSTGVPGQRATPSPGSLRREVAQRSTQRPPAAHSRQGDLPSPTHADVHADRRPVHRLTSQCVALSGRGVGLPGRPLLPG
jgi:hypothetical protein